jgi:hypothetical protein
MLTINEYKIKLGGIANVPKDLNLEKDCDLTIKNAETCTSKIIPNGDGTCDKVISIKITERSEVNILAENEIIKAKKKGSQSQAMRNAYRTLWEQQFSAQIEFEDFYKREMSTSIKNIEHRLL